MWNETVIAVPTMPARRPMLARLLVALERECLGAGVVTREHREGDPPRVDFPAVLEAALAVGRRWVLQLEDDVELAPRFGALAAEALQHTDREGVEAVTLFSRSARDLEMLARGERWRRQAPSSFCMMQAVAVRADVLAGFAAWAPSWYDAHPEHVHAADLLLGAWLSRQRARMLVHVPSLVQHRAGPSTLPGARAHARQSETFRRAFGASP